MKDKIRRLFAIIALILVVAVLGAIGYAIWKWSAGTWQAFGATALLILGGSVVFAGLLVLPFGVSLTRRDNRSIAYAKTYIANLTKTPQPAVAGPVYTITQIDDPDVEKRLWERNTIDTWIVWKDDDGLYACVPVNKLGQKMWERALQERYEDSTPAWNRIRPLRKELGWVT